MYIYPDNLRAKPKLWLWELRDVAVIGIGFLFSVLALANGSGMLLMILTVLFAFLSIRMEGASILDFLRCLLPVPAPAILRVECPTKMTDAEMRQWLAVTENSRFQWTEDKITSLNGRGALYYFGGEDGIYIRIQPGGELSVGTYKGAFPHIGEALFTRKAVMDCGDFNRAFQKAAQLGGRQFLQDMFSSKPSQEFIEIPAPPGMGMQMM